MHIIVSHPNADLDAFASVIGASRLHPGAVAVRSAMLSPVVREFVALHKDRFPTVLAREIDAEEVTRLTVVDVRGRSRLKEIAPVLARVDRGEVALEIFDHHPSGPDDLVTPGEVVEPVGACVTLIVERLREAGHVPDAVEATLYALAVHADTGSLTYANTTARDAAVLAWCLDNGADVRQVARYLERELSAEQRRTLVSVLGQVQVDEVGGVEIGTLIHPLTEKVNGLGEVVRRVLNIQGIDVLFGFFVTNGGRIDVIARSRVGWVDVGEALRRLTGGGGHAAAAAGNTRGREPEALRDELLALLRAEPPRPTTVADVMTSPVRCVQPDVRFRDLAACLRTWRHTGVPVVRDGELVGVVSQRDVEKAERDDALDDALAGRMSTHVRTVSPDDTLEDALDVITRHDVGRLPVVRDGVVVGILTRTDLLRRMYGGEG